MAEAGWAGSERRLEGRTVDYVIERVKTGDEESLAYIQTESWKAAFAGILSPEVLEKSTDIARITAMYRRTLEQRMGNGYLLKAEGKPHCIAWWDESRDEDMPGYAELICIHSLPDRWRQGYGSKMMETVLRDVAAAGYKKIMLWVFEANQSARRFYEKHGFAANGKIKAGWGAAEICYEKEL